MRLTPLRSPPARPRTGSVRVHPRKRKEDQKQRQPDRLLFVEPSPRSAAFWTVREAEHGLGSTRASAARDPLLILFSSSWVQATEICRRPVGLGARGCQPHGCGCQASRDGFTASPAHPARPAHPRLLLSTTNQTPPTRGCAVCWKLPAMPDQQLTHQRPQRRRLHRLGHHPPASLGGHLTQSRIALGSDQHHRRASLP